MHNICHNYTNDVPDQLHDPPVTGQLGLGKKKQTDMDVLSSKAYRQSVRAFACGQVPQVGHPVDGDCDSMAGIGCNDALAELLLVLQHC